MLSLPRRVLMTADAVGGVWTYALDLAGGLAEGGVETVLAVLGPTPTPAARAEAGEVPGLHLVETGFALDWLASAPAEVESAGRGIAALAREVGADLVHLNAPALAARARFDAPVVGACHSCVATWWAAVRGGEPPPDFRWRTDLLAAGYRTCDRLLAPSAAFATATAATYGLVTPPAVVHNGRHLPSTAAASDLLEDVPSLFVVTSGRLWDDGKGVASLDRAAAHVGVPVLAAGPLTGPHGVAVTLSHARALGHLTQPELAALLARRPIFASPARYEPFGLGVLEAAQAGCALVLSDIPTFRELWDGAALFVPAGDEAALAAALDRLARHETERASLGGRAAERARRYTVASMAAGTVAVYREALAVRRPLLARAG